MPHQTNEQQQHAHKRHHPVRLNTISGKVSLISSLLHPLKNWILRQTRVDSAGQRIVPCQCWVSVWLYWKVFKIKAPTLNPVHVLPLQIQISVSVRLLSVQYVVVLAEQLGDGVHHQAYRG
jgi:uncharacterized Tic20 family protein